MPKVKSLIEADKRKAVLSFCLSWKGWNDQELERMLNICPKTRRRKMEDISLFTFGEIRQIIHGVPLSPNQISTLLGGVTWDTSGLEMQMKGVL